MIITLNYLSYSPLIFLFLYVPLHATNVFPLYGRVSIFAIEDKFSPPTLHPPATSNLCTPTETQGKPSSHKQSSQLVQRLN